MVLSHELVIAVIVFLGFVFSIVVHECAHGIVAYWRGDDTAYLSGRITLNPIPHLDPFMSIVLPAMLLLTTGHAFGGAKPVPVDVSRLRHPVRDMMWVALAGPLSNVLLAIGFALTANAAGLLPHAEMAINVRQILFSLVFINLLLAVFNLIPIPPLDGSRILAGLLPPELRAALLSLESIGLLLVMGLIFLGPRVGLNVLWPAFQATSWVWNLFVFTA